MNVKSIPVMKVAILLVTLLSFQSLASAQVKITLDADREPAVRVLASIERQSGYSFVYDEANLTLPPLTVHVTAVPLEEALRQCFRDLSVSYKIVRKNILLKKVKSQPGSGTGNANVTDTITVRGQVTDSLGHALAGATVKVKGTNRAATINESGTFQLAGINRNATIQVSYLGFATREIKAQESLGAIVLHTTSSELGEIEVKVQTGYQTISRERATGAYAAISASDFKQQRLSSLDALLEGRIAGYNRGLIRGTTTMNSVSSPLYVVDGFPIENNTQFTSTGSLVESLPGLNLEDIESITVLKDAAAASIYGARAANGVIVIVTKKAKRGKPRISASATMTYVPNYLYADRQANAGDIIELEKEWAARNPDLQGPGAAANAQSLLENRVYTSQGTQALLKYYAGQSSQAQLDNTLNELAAGGLNYYNDVKKYARRSQLYQQYNVSGGNTTDNNSFYSSLTYRRNAYQKKYSNDESLGLNVKNATRLARWLNFEVGTYLSYSRRQEQTYDPLSPGYDYMPYDRLVNPDGSHFTSKADTRLSQSNLNIINQYGLYNVDITPLDELSRNLLKSRVLGSRTYAQLKVTFASWLWYQSAFQYEYGNSKGEQLYDKASYYVRNKVNSFAGYTPAGGLVYHLPYGHIFETTDQVTNAYNFRQQLNFDRTFGGKHNVVAIMGTEIRNNKLQYDNRKFYNYDPSILSFDLIDAKSLASAPGLLFGGSFSASDIGMQRENVTRFVSVYGNAAYAYNDKYLLSGSLRWDRSNLWGTSSKYQDKPLWSLGAGWNLHNEGFLDVPPVDVLKLRTSYGIGGNIDPTNSPYMTANYYSNTTVGGIQGNIGSRPNPLLSWEKTATFNIGADFGLFNNRLAGSLDYYIKTGKDLLANTMGVPTEGFGYSTYAINNGQMTNKGIELTLNAGIIRQKDFSWDAGLLLARNKNKVTYVNVEAPVYYLQLDYPTAYPRIGNPFNAIYAYRWAGLDHTGLPQVYDETGKPTVTMPTGLDAIVYAGTTVPVISGSFNSAIRYKDLTLSFLLTFETGHKIRNTDIPMLDSRYNSTISSYVPLLNYVNRDIASRWKNPGDEARTNIPRAVFSEDPNYRQDAYTMYKNADINVLDASNLVLRNISLAYGLPRPLARRMGIESMRVQFNIEHLFTLARSRNAKYMIGGYRAPNYVGGVYLDF